MKKGHPRGKLRGFFYGMEIKKEKREVRRKTEN